MGQQGESKEKTGQQGQSKEKVGETKEQTKEKTTQSKDQSKEKVGETKEQTKEKTTQSKDQQSKEKMGQQSPTGTQQQQGAQPQQGTQQQQGAQQQGTSSAKSVQISSEQRTRIQTTIKSQSVERLSRSRVNFDLRVGTRVPTTVRVFVLPVEIVEIVPQFRGYKYIIVEDEILILDPVTLEIVAIIPA
jgi:hypothetical protein